MTKDVFRYFIILMLPHGKNEEKTATQNDIKLTLPINYRLKTHKKIYALAQHYVEEDVEDLQPCMLYICMSFK